jgi:glutathione S-transferase
MILVGQYDSPFVRRVAVTMNLYAMPFERRILSVFTDFEAMLQLNPLGKVPVLQLDRLRTVLARSGATRTLALW